MAGPYFRNRSWYQHPDPYSPTHSPIFPRAPVYQIDPTREVLVPTRPRPEVSPTQKVLRIPVHFVGSRQADRPRSALKIQKVFRGFLVRKCLKKIKEIGIEVNAIEDRLSKGELVESIRRDEKERLKINENLMSLLFKLDSICGVDFGVRSCRKAVIRKAIALQESIDCIDLGEEEDPESPSPSPNLESELKLEGEKGMEIEDEKEIVDVVVDREMKSEEKGEVMMEKMMKVMSELCEKCEVQTRMINALTNRVELLEKAFVCDKIRQSKKKNKKKASSPRRDE